jgi:hypothetical protein
MTNTNHPSFIRILSQSTTGLLVAGLWSAPVYAQPVTEHFQKGVDPSVPTADYIGHRHVGDDFSGLSDEWNSLGGWIVYDPGPDPVFEYGIALVEDGDEFYVFFEQEVGRSGNSALWEILDFVTLPADDISPVDPEAHYYFHFGCSVNGVADAEIVALFGIQDAELITDIRQAWKANRQTGQLEDISTAGMVCINPAWGV